MTNEEHKAHLGALIANLHTLEFYLRAYFQNKPGSRPFGVSDGTNIYLCAEGTELPENDFTSYENLGDLIKRYNKVAASKRTQLLDERIVTLRNALAHGRVACPYSGDSDPFHLIKFSKPRDHRVKVEFNQRMTEQWYIDQVDLVRGAWKAVCEDDAAQ